MERSHQFSRTRPCQRFLGFARNDRRGVARNDKRPVISTKRSAWRDLFYHPGIKSSLSLFMVSINQSFLVLDHFFNCFSLAMACSTSENVSKYTSLWQLYFCVKPGIFPDLCSAKRLSKSFVTPMYSIELLLLERM